MPLRDHQPKRCGDADIEEIGDGALRQIGARQHRPAGAVGPTEKTRPAIGKAPGADHDLEGTGQHQRDKREIEPAQPQRRNAENQPDHRRDDAAGQKADFEGRVKRMADAQRHPAADADKRKLAQGDETELAIENGKPDHGQRERHGRRGRRQPEGSGEKDCRTGKDEHRCRDMQ
ncbi:hypothetical protein D9M72_531480 [compost metagenome]